MRILVLRNAVPFIPAHDIARGIFHMGQAALGYSFMLAVMYVTSHRFFTGAW